MGGKRGFQVSGLVSVTTTTPRWLSGKESACQCRRPGFHPWVGTFPWRKEMATDSSMLAWETPWTEEPGGLQATGSQRVGHDLDSTRRSTS